MKITKGTRKTIKELQLDWKEETYVRFKIIFLDEKHFKIKFRNVFGIEETLVEKRRIDPEEAIKLKHTVQMRQEPPRF